MIRLAGPTSTRALLVAAFAAATPSARAQVFDYSLEGNAPDLELGESLSQIGDVDQDGCEDYAVGIPLGHSGDGEVLVFSGRTGAEISRVHGRAGSRFGVSIDGRIDVDQDGFPDVLIGAPSDDKNATLAGRVVIYSPHLDSILLDVHGSKANLAFGDSVRAMQDDLDGDHVEDFIVGAPFADAVFVLSGADGSVIFHETGELASLFGDAVASGGKLDGDGFVDFVVGSPLYTGSNLFPVGHVDAYSGKDGTLLWSRDGTTLSQFGGSLARPGDLDGDSHGDIVVGAPNAVDSVGSPCGSVTVLSGATGTPWYEVFGAAGGDAFGCAVRSAGGDLDGDGTNDFLVGADQDGGSIVGYAQSISGATGAVLFTFTQRTHDPILGSLFGSSVAGGDANGDGHPDVLVGARFFDDRRGLVEAWLTAVAGWSNYGSGVAGSLGVPQLTAQEDPVVGRTFHVGLSDSTAAPTSGLLMIGVDSAYVPTGKGGTLLVAPLLTVPLSIPPAGLVFTSTLPSDPALYGFHLYLQALELDSGALKGWSFTPGLELVFGFQ